MVSVLPRGDENGCDDREDAEDDLKSTWTERSAEPFLEDHASSVAVGAVLGRRPICESSSSDPP
ncbi:hypothetical protein GCM10020369_10040 [Cryptosporangium minutisporangium]|uniref:Uncharacterized protein n=1 Tax=Cryptosporangium minutisporangium TaxID=113569 RepID=A0ABP6SSP8_9ACTN